MHALHRLLLRRHIFLKNRFRSMSDSSKIEWPSNRVRNTFIDYFKSEGYKFVPSSSLIPIDDKSILYVNAGMNQFKPIFLGTLDPKDVRSNYRLICNSQKCVRAGGKHNDLAEVGRDGTHHTFFEMLGNWAFDGNLTKKESCRQALKLLTEIYGLEKERLFVTYFRGDDSLGLKPDLETKEIWAELGFPRERIRGLGMDDNFWEMSAVGGPCGPCTEIMYCRNNPPSFETSTEIWNLVFISYNKLADGRLIPLPKIHLDTGMGFERLCSILQNGKTNYDTDLFEPIMREIQIRIRAPKYGGKFGQDDSGGIDTSYRILADHARMITFAISDGVAPASNRAGNILRRVIRSASYQSKLLRSNVARKQRGKLELIDLCTVVARVFEDAYPELKSNLDYVKDVVSQEEQIFEESLQKAKIRFGVLLSKKARKIGTQDMFKFYVEHGLPHEILISMAKDRGVEMDEKEFEKLDLDFRNSTRIFPTEAAFEADAMNVVNCLKNRRVLPTDDSFKYKVTKIDLGRYSIDICRSKIVAIAQNDRLIDSAPIDTECAIVLDRTSFYAEAGGQVGDRGRIECDSGGAFDIENTYARGGYVFHQGRLIDGKLKTGDTVETKVDGQRRSGCMQHHTATHLVMAVLERLLGRVRQRSSRLDSEISKLGFWSAAPVTPSLIAQLERDVNVIIRRNVAVFVDEIEFETAKQCADIRWINGEYYPESVRVVTIGMPPSLLLGRTIESGDRSRLIDTTDRLIDRSDQFDRSIDSLISAELCCGTHLASVGDIDRLRIVSVEEGSSGAIKTISFVVGNSAEAADRRGEEMREKVSADLQKMKTTGSDVKASHVTKLKEKVIDALIPFEIKGEILKEIREFSDSNVVKRIFSVREKQ